jgi:hypothetical protein
VEQRAALNVARVIARCSYHFVIAVWRVKETQSGVPMKFWEIIADNLSKAGWSWGCVLTVDFVTI